MTPIEIKDAITKMAAMHAGSGDAIEDLKDTDLLEQQAFDLIISYCRKMNYKVDGFPSASVDDDLTDEHWMLYVDKLTLHHEDVAHLHWHWVVSFWPEEFENIEAFMDMVRSRIGGSFYDVTLF